MKKTRIPVNDFGDRKDGKYSNSTSGFYIPSATWTYLQDHYQDEYTTAMKNASSVISSPTGSGFELIENMTRYKRPRFNNVYHEKKWAYNYPYLICTSLQGSNYATWSPYMRLSMNGSFNTIPLHLDGTWADIDGCQRRAWWNMQPRFESEISMLNFIYELKDFKYLMKSLLLWRQTMGKLRNLVTAVRELENSPNLGKTSSGTSIVAAQAHLTYQFAVKPLINDVRTLLQIWEDTISEAQNEFEMRGLSAQKSHYSECLASKTTGSFFTGSLAWLHTGTYQEVMYTATLEYTYNYIRRVGGELYRHYLGFNLTAGVIWEAIPFSFLVDYFCRIGNAIHAMSVDPNVRLNVLQYCESIKHTAFIGRSCKWDDPIVKIWYCPSFKGRKREGTRVPVCGYSYDIYDRQVGHPNKGPALPKFKLPSIGQATNIAALVRSILK